MPRFRAEYMRNYRAKQQKPIEPMTGYPMTNEERLAMEGRGLGKPTPGPETTDLRAPRGSVIMSEKSYALLTEEIASLTAEVARLKRELAARPTPSVRPPTDVRPGSFGEFRPAPKSGMR